MRNQFIPLAIFRIVCIAVVGHLTIVSCASNNSPVDPPPIVWKTYVPDVSRNLISLMIDRRGIKWVGTDGDGAVLLSSDNMQWMPMSTTGRPEANTIVDIAIDPAGNTWIATLVGVAVVSPIGETTETLSAGVELPGASLQDVAFDNAGNPWFATWGGGVSTQNRETGAWTNYRLANGLLDDHVAFIRVDADDNKWFGTASGVSMLSAHNEWRAFGEASGFGAGAVWSIVGDINGSLWCATQGGGVVVLGAGGQKLFAYTTENGLPDNTVNDVLIDTNGNKWFATNNGLSVLTQDGSSLSTFTAENGLGSNIVTELSMDPAGNIWAATYGGGLSLYVANVP